MQSWSKYRNIFEFEEKLANNINYSTKLEVCSTYNLIYDGVQYSNNENNRYSSTINVIPLTAELKSLCVHVLVEEYLECGLKEKSMLLPEQLTTIDKSQLKSKVGKLSTTYMKKIDKAIDIQFARNRNTDKELANE